MDHFVGPRRVCKEFTRRQGFLGDACRESRKVYQVEFASLGVDATGVTAMVARLKRAATKYVTYKFWVPILRRSDSSVVILVVSIDA